MLHIHLLVNAPVKMVHTPETESIHHMHHFYVLFPILLTYMRVTIYNANISNISYFYMESIEIIKIWKKFEVIAMRDS